MGLKQGDKGFIFCLTGMGTPCDFSPKPFVSTARFCDFCNDQYWISKDQGVVKLLENHARTHTINHCCRHKLCHTCSSNFCPLCQIQLLPLKAESVFFDTSGNETRTLNLQLSFCLLSFSFLAGILHKGYVHSSVRNARIIVEWRCQSFSVHVFRGQKQYNIPLKDFCYGRGLGIKFTVVPPNPHVPRLAVNAITHCNIRLLHNISNATENILDAPEFSTIQVLPENVNVFLMEYLETPNRENKLWQLSLTNCVYESFYFATTNDMRFECLQCRRVFINADQFRLQCLAGQPINAIMDAKLTTAFFDIQLRPTDLELYPAPELLVTVFSKRDLKSYMYLGKKRKRSLGNSGQYGPCVITVERLEKKNFNANTLKNDFFSGIKEHIQPSSPFVLTIEWQQVDPFTVKHVIQAWINFYDVAAVKLGEKELLGLHVVTNYKWTNVDFWHYLYVNLYNSKRVIKNDGLHFGTFIL